MNRLLAYVPVSGGGRFRYQPERHYGIRAKFSIYATGSNSTDNFLQNTRILLGELQVKHIINIWVGNKSLFSIPMDKLNTNNRYDVDNLATAFDTTSGLGWNSAEDAGVSGHGFGELFETEFQFTFKHDAAPPKPSITVEVLALPLELSWQEGEDLLDHIDKLNSFFDDKKRVNNKNEEVKAIIPGYLDGLRSFLLQTYGASYANYEFSVDLGSVVW